MGRRVKILPTSELMGLVASRKLRGPVIGFSSKSINKLKLNLKPIHWERLNTRQKLTAANIALHLNTIAYTFTLNLSPKLVTKLKNPTTAQDTFNYVRDRVYSSFKAAGERKPLFWYVMENMHKHASARNTFNHGFSKKPKVPHHLHGGFSLLSPEADTTKLSLLLKKNLGGSINRAVKIEVQGSTLSNGLVEQNTVAGLMGTPRYACKNLPLKSLPGLPRPFVISRPLQQATMPTLDWLSS
jgi:hypothetical protein